ncbi:MAG: hypothetical protein Q8R30_00320 [bacterium]|nr:hypothetical protein [bacterium]MDZ4286030.1 hypothetical protein [Candidatus Sungbacteria bacterium]
MKRINHLMALIMVCVFVSLVSAVVAAAQVADEDRRDAERVAQVFGGITVEYYDGQFGFQRSATQWVDGRFELRRVNGMFMITYLEVDGMVIVNVKNGDKPLGVLPTNVVGDTRNFNLWLSGYDSQRNFIVSGSFFTDLLNAQDPIVVELDPALVRLAVPFIVPRGANQANVRLVIQGDGYVNSAPYSSYAGGFDIYVDPTKVDDYRILDTSTSIVYQTGKTDTLALNPVEIAQGSVINLLLPKGDVEIPFTAENSFFNLERQELDGMVMRPCPPPATAGCEERDAKVYLARIDRKNMFFTLSGPQSELFKVEVRKWVAKGPMQLLDESESGPYPSVDVRTGYEIVVITVLAANPKIPPPQYFDVFVSSF